MRVLFWALLILISSVGCLRKSGGSKFRDVNVSALSFERKADALARVRELDSTYKKVRDQILLGQGGIRQFSEQINEEVLKLTEEWRAIYQFIDSSAQLAPSEIKSKIASCLISQTEHMARIANLRDQLGRIIDSGRRQLVSAPRVSYQIIGFESQYAALEVAIDRLDRTLVRIADESKNSQKRLESSSPLINSALIQRLKVKLLTRSHDKVEQIINAVDAWFAAEAIVSPIEGSIRQKYFETIGYFLAGRIFRMDLEYSDLTKKCQEAETNIASALIDPDYKQGAISRIRATCRDVSDKNAYLHSNSVSINRLVAGAHSRRLNRALIACASPTPQLVNCSMLPWLSQATKEHIESMQESQLRNLELAWDVFEQDSKGEVF